ncbi:6-deoxy-6-sulfogluconolactonase [subsurface metagenome]
MKPELVVDYKLAIGENPLWHPYEKKLYWIDIQTACIFRYDPVTRDHEQVYKGDVVGGFTIQVNGALLLFMSKGAIKVWKAGELSTIIDEIPDERETRFNDVIADPEGRVFCGTMPTNNRPGRLYRLELDGALKKILDGIGCSNGMGFTPDRKHMYYTDSSKREIYLFDYDQSSGNIEDKRVFVTIQENEGVPDGMTVDRDGYVWSARWDGGCIVRYAPDGKENLRIEFPAKKVSSVTFGGDDYMDIYVTTAGGDKRDKEGYGAGALFRLNLGIQGVPEFISKICL